MTPLLRFSMCEPKLQKSEGAPPRVMLKEGDVVFVITGCTIAVVVFMGLV
jgi:hypothetical protein